MSFFVNNSEGHSWHLIVWTDEIVDNFQEPNESKLPLKKFKQDFNHSNHYAKSETIEKKTDLKKGADMNKHLSSVHTFKCQLCPANKKGHGSPYHSS